MREKERNKIYLKQLQEEEKRWDDNCAEDNRGGARDGAYVEEQGNIISLGLIESETS